MMRTLSTVVDVAGKGAADVQAQVKATVAHVQSPNVAKAADCFVGASHVLLKENVRVLARAKLSKLKSERASRGC